MVRFDPHHPASPGAQSRVQGQRGMIFCPESLGFQQFCSIPAIRLAV